MLKFSRQSSLFNIIASQEMINELHVSILRFGFSYIPVKEVHHAVPISSLKIALSGLSCPLQ
jgi:hypothetical protein